MTMEFSAEIIPGEESDACSGAEGKDPSAQNSRSGETSFTLFMSSCNLLHKGRSLSREEMAGDMGVIVKNTQQQNYP